MKKKITRLFSFITVMAAASIGLTAQQPAASKKMLGQQFDLVREHSPDTQYFELESKLQKHGADGAILGVDVYHLYLRCVPSRNASKGDEYTCLKFNVVVNNATPLTIPSLNNYKYTFSLDPTKDTSKKTTLFGIDPAKFEQLRDQDGKAVPLENNFHVYNAFIDFHTMNVFSDRTAKDSGAQDLKHIGDKVVHQSAYSEPHMSLGKQVSDASYFKNGKVTLEFKGLALVNKSTCAILEYDSGNSSFYMLTKPMANMEVKTKGSSHYWGDIYKDLSSAWIQKAVLHELVVSETEVPGMKNKISSVIERTININNVAQIKF